MNAASTSGSTGSETVEHVHGDRRPSCRRVPARASRPGSRLRRLALRPAPCRPAAASSCGEHRAGTDDGAALLGAFGRTAHAVGLRTQVSSATRSPAFAGALDRVPAAALHGAGSRSCDRCRRRRPRRCGARLRAGDVDVAEVRHDFERGDVGQFALARRFGARLDARGCRPGAARSRGRRSSKLSRSSRRGSPARTCVAVALLDDLGRAPCRGGSP